MESIQQLIMFLVQVILIQEQMSKNRMIVEQDRTGQLTCQVTSSTHNVKSRTNVSTKNGRYYLKLSLLEKEAAVAVVFKAMGVRRLGRLPIRSVSRTGFTPGCAGLWGRRTACHSISIFSRPLWHPGP